MATGTATVTGMRADRGGDAGFVPRRPRTGVRSGALVACAPVFFGVVLPVAAQSLPITGTAPTTGAIAPVGPAPAIGEGGAGGQRRAWSVVPRVSATMTLTDNVSAVGTGGKQDDIITSLAPGVRVSGETARLRVFADYSLRVLSYARTSGRDTTQNALNTFGTFEAVERWLFVDAGWTISQQTISAFGAQNAGVGSLNANSTETSNFRLSPYLRGRLGSLADYELRYSINDISSKSALTTNTRNELFSGRLNGATALAALGWGLEGNRQSVEYANGRQSQIDNIRGRLIYTFNPSWRANFSLGQESNNFSQAGESARTTHGFGADWTPNERTRVSAFREKRFFGFGHNISASYRTPFAALRFVDTRDVSVTPNQSGTASVGTYYDLLFAQLASSVPDPVARAQQVNSTLAQAGISPTATITNGFLSSRALVRRRQDVSLIFNGRRNTVTYTLFQSEQQSATVGAAGVDDFTASTSIRQRGMSSNLSHRLSASTSINTLTSWQRSEGNTGISTKTTNASLGVTTRFGARTSGSFTLRMTRSDGVTSFAENAVLAALNVQF